MSKRQSFTSMKAQTTSTTIRKQSRSSTAMLGIGQGEDKYRNDTKYGVESTFTTILGREAAYKGETISWERLWNSSDRLSFKS
ncbi:MAG: hypothetical protein WKF84_01965 [Pyrinomonadaceae bacterium]